MWVTIIAEYECELAEDDVTAIENGEMTLQDIDAWYYVDNFSTADVTDIRES